jgi:topoisomerase-4 subunit B
VCRKSIPEGKYDSKAFKKSVGLNGVGTKAVNALSAYFKVYAVREGEMKCAEFERGELVKDHKVVKTDEKNGTYVEFIPDTTIFKNYHFINDYVEQMVMNYTYLNTGLAFHFNGQRFISQKGLHDLLSRKKAVETCVTLSFT